MKESQVLLPKEGRGKANGLLPPLMQGPIPALCQNKGTEDSSHKVLQTTQSFAVQAQQAGFAAGLFYLMCRAGRLSHVPPSSENEVHKGELSTSQIRGVQGQYPDSELQLLSQS